MGAVPSKNSSVVILLRFSERIRLFGQSWSDGLGCPGQKPHRHVRKNCLTTLVPTADRAALLRPLRTRSAARRPTDREAKSSPARILLADVASDR